MCANTQTTCPCTIKVHVTQKKSTFIKALYVQITYYSFGFKSIRGSS
jgi:hypothetical protein